MMEFIAKPELLIYVGLYFALLVGMGIKYSKEVETSEDFILAGRTLGPVILAGTLASTWVGGGTITGSTNIIAADNGFLASILIGIPGILAVIILMLIAPKVREQGYYTISELIEERYGTLAKDISTIIIILSFLSITAYQYKGIAMVLNICTGLNIEIGNIIGLVIIIFLAFSGGLFSVAATDAMSALIIIVGLILGIPATIKYGGGWDNIVNIAGPEKMTLTGGLSAMTILSLSIPAVFLLIGNQNMFQRMAASKGEKEMRKGLWGMMACIALIIPCVAIISFSTKTIFPNIDSGMAFLSVTTILPSIIGGLVLAAATALIITTGNSYLLSCATNVTYDIYAKYINKEASDKQKMKVTRMTILVFGIIAYILLRFFPSILAIQMYAYTIYGAGLTPAVLGAVLWEKATKEAGIASMITGTALTILWDIVLKKPFGMDSALISIPAAIIVLIVVGLLTYKKSELIKTAK